MTAIVPIQLTVVADVPARRFFSQLMVRRPAPVPEPPWAEVRVDRFFARLRGRPSGLALNAQRHDCGTGLLALEHAFTDFKWD